MLSHRIVELRSVLQDLDDAINVLGKGIEEGAPIIEALEKVGGTLTVPAMLQTFEDFHAGRQDLRVALLMIAREEGTTASHLARTLGISRQLASRLEAEAEKGSLRTWHRCRDRPRLAGPVRSGVPPSPTLLRGQPTWYFASGR